MPSSRLLERTRPQCDTMSEVELVVRSDAAVARLIVGFCQKREMEKQGIAPGFYCPPG